MSSQSDQERQWSAIRDHDNRIHRLERRQGHDANLVTILILGWCGLSWLLVLLQLFG